MSNETNLTYSGDWTFHLTIINKTKETFKLKRKDINYGYWYTNNKDKNEPVSIPPGTHEVLGIRASSGTWVGYQCSCTWKTEYSALTVSVNVPFTRKNQFQVQLSGDDYKLTPSITDAGLTEKGHNFSVTFTIYDPDDKESLDVETLKSSPLDAYEQLLAGTDELVRNWNRVEAEIPEMVSFNPLEVLPEHYSFPPAQILIARSKAQPIEKNLWEGIGDPVYDTTDLQRGKVSEYFSLALYSINTNPRSVKSMPAGETRVTKKSVEVVSAINETMKNVFSIGFSLDVKAPVGKTGATIAAGLKASYQVENVLEKSSSIAIREEETSTIEASEKNRLFVPWVFSTAVAIYRKRKKDGRIELIAISEWAQQIIDKVYEY